MDGFMEHYQEVMDKGWVEGEGEGFVKFQYKKIKNSLYIKRPVIFVSEITQPSIKYVANVL